MKEMSPLISSFALLFFLFFKPSHGYGYPSYQLSSPFSCNKFTFQYPFQRYLPSDHTTFVNCSDRATISSGNTYRVLGCTRKSSNNIRTLRIADESFFGCQSLLKPVSLLLIYDLYGFGLSQEYKKATLVTCAKEVNYTRGFQQVECFDCGRTNNSCFFAPDGAHIRNDEICTTYTIVIPTYNITAQRNILPFLQGGFGLQLTISDPCLSCEASGGNCYGWPDYDACICPLDVHRFNCSDGEPIGQWRKVSVKLICGLVFGLVTIVAAASIIVYRQVKEMWKRRESEEVEEDMRAYMDPLHSATSPSVRNFLHGGLPQRYSYAQIKRYTNNLAHRIGQGGFGTVFKGELPNGCPVAVKILDKLKHSRKQFLNEVATVGRVHHIHLVRLLGYCFDGSKRALVYEYMVNGSLEKYIHGENQQSLDWKQLYSIALGTARGIAYLHDECRSRILHFDIKPHNVLLDANFSPKVADFGLAKLADREGSHVSLTGARGTPGYAAPEVWSTNHGPVSDRSDVYGYGMLVMEMVGGRKNFNMQASRESQFYYPEWAFKQVEKGEFGMLRYAKREQEGEDVAKMSSLEDLLCHEEDENIIRKLSMVGLWCTQYNQAQRPTMRNVIKMLEGSIEISSPPIPFPVQVAVDTSNSTTM